MGNGCEPDAEASKNPMFRTAGEERSPPSSNRFRVSSFVFRASDFGFRESTSSSFFVYERFGNLVVQALRLLIRRPENSLTVQR